MQPSGRSLACGSQTQQISAAAVFAGSRRRHICHAGGHHSHSARRRSSRCSAARVVAAAAAAAPAPAGGGGEPQKKPGGLGRALLGWLPDRQSVQLVSDAWALLYRNLWAVIAVFLAKDAAAFVLHRLVHRLTNHIAEVGLGLPLSSMGVNPWWISMDAKLMEGHIGYQVLVGLFFLLCLPLNILFNTAAVSTAAVVAINRQAVLDGPGVPTASFTGQGRGKVGLADYPRPPPSCLDEEADDCDASFLHSPGSSLDSIDGSSSSSGSSAERRGGTGVGAAQFRGGVAAVSFRGSTAAAPAVAAAASSSASGVQPSQQQQQTAAAAGPSPNNAAAAAGSSAAVMQPAAAPALPWLTVVQERSKPPPLLGPKASLAVVQEAWTNQVTCRIRGLWQVDVLFNVWALPLQAASLAVLPVFWTFPRLLGIQLALPAAVLGGARGTKALDESRALMAGFKSSYAWPFVWLIAAGRLLEVVREVVLLAMPNRWWTDVPEVPLVATAAFFAARVLLLRVQDMLPLAGYLLLVRQQSRQKGSGSGGGDVALAGAAAP